MLKKKFPYQMMPLNHIIWSLIERKKNGLQFLIDFHIMSNGSYYMFEIFFKKLLY